MNMTNLQRLMLETKGIDLDQNELAVYLAENEATFAKVAHAAAIEVPAFPSFPELLT